VLWQAIKKLLIDSNHSVLVYSLSKRTSKEIRDGLKARFDLDVPDSDRLHFVDLDPSTQEHLNGKKQIFFQAIRSMKAVYHALALQPCDIFVDTYGVAFAYPLIKALFPTKIYSYTHYPTVQEDMLKTVAEGRK